MHKTITQNSKKIVEKKAKTFIAELRKQTLALSTAGLAFVAALVWRDAIIAWLEPFLVKQGSAITLTSAALIVTIIIVLMTVLLTKFLGEQKN